MPLNIQESDGHVDIAKTSWMFYGPPKIGKTTLASGFPNALFLVTSEKEVHALKTNYILIDSWAETKRVTKELIAARRRQFNYINIDFIDAVWTNCVGAVCDKLDISHVSEAGWAKGYDTVDMEFKRWVLSLTASDYGLIFISHTQTKEVQKQGRTVVKTVGTLPDRARKILNPLIANIGYIDMESVQVRDEKTGKPKYVERRCISFEPSEYLEAGNRDNVVPDKLPLYRDPRKSYALFKQYYDGVKTAHGRR